MKRIAPLFVLALLGCSDLQRIYNGTAATQPHHKAVVSLHQKGDKNIFCSGTMISKTVVLTAAHCLYPPPAASSLWVYVGDNATTEVNPKFYDVAQVLVHPGYNEQTLVNDIAMLKLTAEVPVEPVRALPKSLPFVEGDTGEPVNFAGFGKTEKGTYDQKLQVNGHAKINRGNPMTLYYTQEAGGPCFGDSGGPAFVVRDGARYVAGVTSYGDSACTAYGVSTRVDSFEEFVVQLAPLPPPASADAGTPDAGVLDAGTPAQKPMSCGSIF